jgi:exodeoxyribonuclease VIII
MNDVMLDLETMGTSNDAAIVAIGAVEFDVVGGTVGEVFYYPIDLGSSVAEGGVIDAATVMWWLRQSDAARKALYDRFTMPIRQGLDEFAAWMSARGKDVKVWGNGAAFDNVILAQAYRRMGLPVPWRHWNDRCYRTVKALYPDIQMQRTGVHHNAGDDAVSQAQHLLQILSAQRQRGA